MNLKLFRIYTTIISFLPLPFYIFSLYKLISNVITNTLIVIAAVLVCFLLNTLSLIVSIKNINNNSCMLYDLAFEVDGKINKFAFIVSIILLLFGLTLSIVGIIEHYIFNNFNLTYLFISVGLTIISHFSSYLIYIIDVKRNVYLIK